MQSSELEACREAFEEWTLTVNESKNVNWLAKKESGEYQATQTAVFWITWQAAWEARGES